MKRICAINLGATSTKLAYYEDAACICQDSIVHSTHELSEFETLADQVPLRMETVQAWAQTNNVDFTTLDAFVSRGGLTQPVPGGVLAINDAMVAQALSGKFGVHPCGIGVKIAYELTKGTNALALVVDSPVTDELEPVARYSGLAEVQRSPKCQALNAKAVAKAYAKDQGKELADINMVIATMGGGTSVVACKGGRLIDTNDGVLGEGPFATNRCGSVPLGPVVEMCYAGMYTFDEMMHHLNGDAGFIAYLGTGDARKIEQRIAGGDTFAEEVLDAFCYQVAKEIGAMATVLEGRIDAIVLSGGMAHSNFVVDHIKRRIQFIAPVLVVPGGDEMAALWLGAWEALQGIVAVQEFVPASE